MPSADNEPGVGAGRALVVGASSAIGTAVAVMLAEEGFATSLWGRNPKRLAAAAQAVAAARGVRCSTTVVDVTDHARVGEEAGRLRATGGLRAVVWAVGEFDWAAADRADGAVWARLLDVNLTAAAVLTAAVLPALVDASPSALVYLGSSAARRAYPNNAAYVASKHGLAGLAHATFLDVRDAGVKVSLVSPGLVAAGVRFVVTFPTRRCPVEIDLQPQLST